MLSVPERTQEDSDGYRNSTNSVVCGFKLTLDSETIKLHRGDLSALDGRVGVSKQANFSSHFNGLLTVFNKVRTNFQ